MKTLSRLMLVLLVAGTSPAFAKKADDAKAPSSSGASQATSATAGAANADVRSQIQDWPQSSKSAALAMIDRYGQPDVASNLVLIWKDKQPFSKIAVMRDAVKHSFPIDHQDVLLQEVNLIVPLEKVSDLAKFDGSLLIDRTKGTVASRCDSEKSNFLALNLAKDIISGKRDVESARRFMSDTMAKTLAGKSSEYSERLMFSPATSGTGSSDASTMPDSRSGNGESVTTPSDGSPTSSPSSNQGTDVGQPGTEEHKSGY